jgi:WD40 repeat protein
VLLLDAQNGSLQEERFGHEAPVTCAAFSHDGRWLATADHQGRILAWDTSHAAQPKVLEGHTASVRGLAFHPRLCLLASCGWDRTIRIWDVQAGQKVREWIGGVGLAAVAYSLEGSRLCSGGGWEDPVVRLWDAESGSEVRALSGHFSYVNDVAFLPGEPPLLATCSGDATLCLWDAATGMQRATLRLPALPMRMSVHPQGRLLAVAFSNGTVSWWEVDRVLHASASLPAVQPRRPRFPAPAPAGE